MDDYEFKVPKDDGPESEDEKRRKMNHEIRSISHGLLGYLAIFSEEVEGKLGKEEKELLSRVQYYSHKLSDLVLELLSTQSQKKESTKSSQ